MPFLRNVACISKTCQVHHVSKNDKPLASDKFKQTKRFW